MYTVCVPSRSGASVCTHSNQTKTNPLTPPRAQLTNKKKTNNNKTTNQTNQPTDETKTTPKLFSIVPNIGVTFFLMHKQMSFWLIDNTPLSRRNHTAQRRCFFVVSCKFSPYIPIGSRPRVCWDVHWIGRPFFSHKSHFFSVREVLLLSGNIRKFSVKLFHPNGHYVPRQRGADLLKEGRSLSRE